MLKVIREQLLKIIDDIDTGNSDITEEDSIKIALALRKYTKKDILLSKYQSYTYLNISRAKFDNLVKEGKLPKGTKRIGHKELDWNKRDLDDYIRRKRNSETNKGK